MKSPVFHTHNAKIAPTYLSAETVPPGLGARKLPLSALEAWQLSGHEFACFKGVTYPYPPSQNKGHIHSQNCQRWILSFLVFHLSFQPNQCRAPLGLWPFPIEATNWLVEPTHLKNMRKSNWIISPGVKIPKICELPPRSSGVCFLILGFFAEFRFPISPVSFPQFFNHPGPWHPGNY